MFVIDDAIAEAIRRIWQEQGRLAALVKPRRHSPSITDNARAWLYLQAIVGWTPGPARSRPRLAKAKVRGARAETLIKSGTSHR